MVLAGTTGAAVGTVAYLADFPEARFAATGVGVTIGAGAVGARRFLLPPFALLSILGALVRFAAATTTRALGGGGGGATTFAFGVAVVALLVGLATAISVFFASFAAATTGAFKVLGAATFVAGRLTDFGGAARGCVGAGLRALLDGAFAVATAVLLVFVAVVLSDFFVVNL